MALIEEGYATKIYGCGDGLYIPGRTRNPLSDKDGVWLLLDDGHIEIKANLLLSERHDLANPESIENILNTIRQYRQKVTVKRDASDRALPS